jgi:hypothetical protein
MAKTLSLLLIAFVGLQLALATPALYADNKNITDDQQKVMYYFSASRGFLDGFIKGLYNNNTEAISTSCMDQSTLDKILKISSVLESGDVMELFKSLSLVYQVTFTFDKKCRLQEIGYELTTWCVRANCSVDTIGANFAKNIFAFTGALNEIA